MVKQVKPITEKVVQPVIKTEVEDIEVSYHSDIESMKKAIQKNTNWRIFQQVLLCLSIIISIISYLVISVMIYNLSV